MNSHEIRTRWFIRIVSTTSKALLFAMLTLLGVCNAYAQLADRYRCIPADGGPSYTTPGSCRGDVIRREPLSREEIAEAWKIKNQGRAFTRCTAADHSYSHLVSEDQACPSSTDKRTTEYAQKSSAQLQRDEQVIDAAFASLGRVQSKSSPVADTPAQASPAPTASKVQPEAPAPSALTPSRESVPASPKPRNQFGWLVSLVVLVLVILWARKGDKQQKGESSGAPSTPRQRAAPEVPISNRADMNQKARELLAVLKKPEAPATIPGGLAFSTELQQAGLDYSLQSLDRVDQLLEKIKTKFAPSRVSWQKKESAENFCLLLAFYLGTVISRQANMPLQWYTREQAAHLMPPDMPLPDEDWARLVGVIAASPCVPLGLIESKLFDSDPTGMTSKAYVERFLGKLKTAQSANMDENQRCTILLEAFFGNAPLHGGLAYREQLERTQLDYSLASLQRVDQLLRFLQPEIKPPYTDFINQPETQNFMRLVAFYIGMTVARLGSIPVKWLDFAQAKKEIPELEHQFETSSVCLLGGRVYFPLGLVTEILLHPNATRTVSDWAKQALQFAPPPIPSILKDSMQDDSAAPMESTLQAAIQKAGFVAAWGMFMVAGGANGAPTVFVPGEDGTGAFRDFSFYGDAQSALKAVHDLMDKNPDNAPYQVLSFDGYANLHTGRTDALTIDLRVYCAKPLSSQLEFSMNIVCPYRNANDPKGFAIYSPKLFECSGSEAMHKAIFKHFYLGVASFKSQEFDWFKYLDESV